MIPLTSIHMKDIIEPHIGKKWKGGAKGKYDGKSILMTIPKTMAHKYHLEDPTNIIFIDTNEGILVKKLEIVT
jgi:hypothetical protein